MNLTHTLFLCFCPPPPPSCFMTYAAKWDLYCNMILCIWWFKAAQHFGKNMTSCRCWSWEQQIGTSPMSVLCLHTEVLLSCCKRYFKIRFQSVLSCHQFRVEQLYTSPVWVCVIIMHNFNTNTVGGVSRYGTCKETWERIKQNTEGIELNKTMMGSHTTEIMLKAVTQNLNFFKLKKHM